VTGETDQKKPKKKERALSMAKPDAGVFHTIEQKLATASEIRAASWAPAMPWAPPVSNLRRTEEEDAQATPIKQKLATASDIQVTSWGPAWRHPMRAFFTGAKTGCRLGDLIQKLGTCGAMCTSGVPS